MKIVDCELHGPFVIEYPFVVQNAVDDARIAKSQIKQR